MLAIEGKVNTAVCYATVIEDEAIEQIRRMCDHDFTAGSKIRIMPDVHAGKGCTIGTTMTITDKAVPNVVGVDIGCGMYTVKLGQTDLDFVKIDEAAHYIPSGRDVWEGRIERFDLTGLRCYRDLKQTKRLERSLARWAAATTSLKSTPRPTERSIWSSTRAAAIWASRSPSFISNCRRFESRQGGAPLPEKRKSSAPIKSRDAERRFRTR